MVRFAALTILTVALVPLCVFGQTGRTVQPRDGWSAVNHAGKSFSAREFPNQMPPWAKDLMKAVKPEYPFEERRRKHKGSGVYRMDIDLKTGSVRKVTIVKSAEFNRLDESAKNALVQWRFRPNSWKELTLPVEFVMPNPDGSIPSIGR